MNLWRKARIAHRWAINRVLLELASYPCRWREQNVAAGAWRFAGAQFDTLFLVTSVVNAPIGRTDWNIFSPEERFKQTLETINSIRARVPDAYLLLIESSRISSYQRSRLSRSVETLLELSDDPKACALRDGSNKGTSEAYMLQRGLEAIAGLPFRRMFKISGRYTLGPTFQLENFDPDRVSFRFPLKKTASTRLYCWGGTRRAWLVPQLRKAEFFCRLGCQIEDVIWRGIPPDGIARLSKLGLVGRVATRGIDITE